MIVSDEAAMTRLNSPLNLMNRLLEIRSKPKSDAMNLFIKPAVKPPNKLTETETEAEAQTSDKTSEAIERSEVTLDDIIENTENRIKLGLAHDTALKLLNNSVALLAEKLDDVKADKLPQVIGAASKVVESIRRERHEAEKSGKDREVHYHFYTPQQKKLADYKVIDVQ